MSSFDDDLVSNVSNNQTFEQVLKPAYRAAACSAAV